jgi:hypothetical protein
VTAAGDAPWTSRQHPRLCGRSLAVFEDLYLQLADGPDHLEHLGRVSLDQLDVSRVDEVLVEGGVDRRPAVVAGGEAALGPGVVDEGAVGVDQPGAEPGRKAGGAGNRGEEGGDVPANAFAGAQDLRGARRGGAPTLGGGGRR